MRGRLAAAALAVALARVARSEDLPDWFEPFRGAETYLAEDSSWLARDPALPADAPPVVRMRHLLLLLKTEGAPPVWWERRNLLLVELPNGHRYAAELAFKMTRPGHLPEPTPWLRLAGASGAVETWEESHGDPPTTGEEPAPSEEPCYGLLHVTRGGGRSLRYHFFEVGKLRTVRAGLADVRDAVLSESEREEVWGLRRLPIEPVRAAAGGFPSRDDVLGARIAWGLLFLDRKRSPDERRLLVEPDPAPPGDVASWRALTYIPLTMRTMELPLPAGVE